MTVLSYNANVPNPPDDPADDVGPMLVNAQSINSWVSVDHIGFNSAPAGASSGMHKQTQMVAAGLPGGLIATAGTTYVKNVQVAVGPINNNSLFYTPNNLGVEYQLTRTIDGVAGFFGTFTNNYNGVGAQFTGGWTFLPGGLLFQYGIFDAGVGGLASSGTIPFPVQFINSPPFSIQPVLICKAAGTSTSHTVSVISGTPSATSFQWNFDTATSAYTGIYWTAIGK